MTQQQLQRLFETYNRRYFEGRLPSYRIVLSDRYGKGDHGKCRTEQREIHLGTRLRGAELKRFLLHEMAHAATRGDHSLGGHGKQWLAEMLRLAEMGAPTREDWNIYQDPTQTCDLKQIAGEFYDAGLETKLPWRSVRLQLGRELGLTDDRGRSESKSAAKTLRQLRKEFSKGRRFSSAIKAGRAWE